jgi:hypothetical protein
MYQWFCERTLGGSNLHVYFLPDRNYPFQIQGVFRLDSIQLFQDLSLTLDQFYRTYLRYALAERICSEYSCDTPVNVTKELRKYEAFIDKRSRVLDLSLTKVSTMQRITGLNTPFLPFIAGGLYDGG